jgi:hypothetical protein
MLERSERVNSGMYIQLHNAARAMSALGHHQPLSITSHDRLVSSPLQPLGPIISRIPFLSVCYYR